MKFIQYALLKQNMSSKSVKYYARVMSYKNLGLDDIISVMKAQGTGVSEVDMRATLQLLFDSITASVADGYNVNLPLAKFTPAISGLFDSLVDTFDDERHSVKMNISAGPLLKEAMKGASAKKVKSNTPTPSLYIFHDVYSGLKNERITSGSIGSIIGDELKFDQGNAEEGIFFVGDTTTRVEMIASKTERKLVFNIPPLSPGNYTIEIRRGYRKTNRENRSGALPEQLVVL